jgi:Putative quorum-sensing-regulated virulence factor
VRDGAVSVDAQNTGGALVFMTFGKHRGKRLEDIPGDYLLWCLDNMGNLSPTLRRGIEDVLGVNQALPLKIPETVRNKVRETIKTWYRHASRKYHPDHGGNNDKQIVVNDCYETLVRAIESELV